MNGSNKRANHTALTQLTSSPKRDERDEVKGQDREHKGKSHLLLYPPSFANIPAHLSLDTLHFSPFDSDTIPNTMDLIPNSVCKKANKKTLAKTLIRKKKKKEKEEGSNNIAQQIASFVSFATASLLSSHSNKDEEKCLKFLQHFTSTH